MAEIVNLRQARKAKGRREAEAKAAANRIAHGLPKAEKRLARALEEQAARKLEGHRRDDED